MICTVEPEILTLLELAVALSPLNELKCFHFHRKQCVVPVSKHIRVRLKACWRFALNYLWCYLTLLYYFPDCCNRSIKENIKSNIDRIIPVFFMSRISFTILQLQFLVLDHCNLKFPFLQRNLSIISFSRSGLRK